MIIIFIIINIIKIIITSTVITITITNPGKYSYNIHPSQCLSTVKFPYFVMLILVALGRWEGHILENVCLRSLLQPRLLQGHAGRLQLVRVEAKPLPVPAGPLLWVRKRKVRVRVPR